MFLFLIRHGNVLSSSDVSLNMLSESGIQQIQSIGSFLEKNAYQVDYIYNSPHIRTRDTAKILSSYHLPRKLSAKERKGLLPEDSPNDMLQEIESSKNNILIVSHLPYLVKLASLALSRDEDLLNIFFSPGQMLILYRAFSSAWSVEAMITPEMVQKLLKNNTSHATSAPS